MKQGLKLFLAGASAGIVLASGMNFASDFTDTVQRTFRDIKITMNGKAVNPTDATGKTVEPFIIDGTTYLPVRAVSKALGANVDWDDATSTVKLTSEEKQKDADARYQEWLKNMKEVIYDPDSPHVMEDGPDLFSWYWQTYADHSTGPETNYYIKLTDHMELYLNEIKVSDNVLKATPIYEGNGGPGFCIYFIKDDGSLNCYEYQYDDTKQDFVGNLTKMEMKNIIDIIQCGGPEGNGPIFININGEQVK